MRKINRFILAGLALALWASPAAAQTATITIQANQPAANISSNLFGIFFEEISMAGDGGIYAELVRNRSFEDAATPAQWTLVTNGAATGSWSIDMSLPLSASNSQSLKLTKASGTSGSTSIGAVNNGYYGIPLVSGKTYNLGVYARAASGFSGTITVSLESTNGSTVYAQGTISGLTTAWQHFVLSLVPNTTDPFARLALRISQNGSVYLDFVSLFPAQTFNNRTNGLRPDLANQLVNLKPSFMRFPGGSWVDGTSLTNAYHWQLTVGDPANRTERANVWGYMVSNGLGYHEYLQMCEDLGTLPLFDINCGMDVHQNAIATSQLGPWVQEALDALQYANGDASTFWGAQRAANGHPAPFNLQYIEIGNENGGAAYDANYSLFYDAIKSNYPAMHIIANSWSGIPASRPVEIMDEHYYTSAATFASYATKYDSYSRSGPKVFVGEYAVAYSIPPSTFPATLQNALGEAAFMTGLERNSDIVQLACYAPLFCNLNNPSWYPDLIYFNGTNVFGTPSYYVQQMFSLNRGNVVLPTTVAVSGNPLYVSSSLVQSSGQIIVKAVNFNSSTMSATFNVNGVGSIASSATVIQLSGNLTNQNSFATPAFVFPVTNVINNAGTSFTATLPAESLSIFKLQGIGFTSVTNLQLQFASPLSVGQEAAAAVAGQISGQTISLAGNYAVTFSSANPAIAVVNGNGLVIGASPGTTSIKATYNGLSATQAVSVVAAPPTTLIHRYSFNDGTADDSAGAVDGTFFNGSGTASIAGGQLNLTGVSGDYVDLGPGIITTTNLTTGAVTFEAWATFNPVNGGWARLFDFGNISGSSGGDYIFLAANNSANGGSARLAVTDTMPGGTGEIGFSLNNLLGQTNVHLVAVFNPAPARQFLGLYTNGILAASASTGGKYIASLNDAFSFLGHSLWSGDAWLNGSINEFRIYNGELDKFQIAASFQAGPDHTNYNVGTLTRFSLNPGTQPMALNSARTIMAGLNFTLASNVSVIGDANLTLSSDNTNIFTISASGLLNAVGVGSANLTGIYDYVSGNTSTFYTNSVTIAVYRDQPALVHRYSFTTDAADSVGGAAWNGALPNGGAFANGQVSLASGSSQYIQLPAGILSNYTAVTIDAWASFGTLPSACFFYGLGNISGANGTQYILCQPQNGRVAISYTNWLGEQSTPNAGSWSGQTNVHVTAVFDPPEGYLALYVNGVLAVQNTAVTVPFAAVNDLYSYIGRSLYSGDSYINTSIDEFRIYKGVLHADEISASQALGPDQLLSVTSPALKVSLSGGNPALTLWWPLASAGFTLVSRTNLATGAWATVSPVPQIVGANWQVTLPVSGNARFFRLQK